MHAVAGEARARTEPIARADAGAVGMWRGAVESLPFQPGALIFRPRSQGGGEPDQGSRFAESIGQSAIVYAGASQMLTLQVWTPDWTLGALLAAVGVTAAINARFLLMSATFRPWIEGPRPPVSSIFSLLFTDRRQFRHRRAPSRGGRARPRAGHRRQCPALSRLGGDDGDRLIWQARWSRGPNATGSISCCRSSSRR
ncbi:MAG: AzlC family ABC transporter permease [Methylobacteriaceae bacterium]|nr:AzlC family ABC transporter permease [Methylobacteriaceae bacterium]